MDTLNTPFHITWEKLNKLFFRSIGELAYSIPLILALYFLLRNKLKILRAETHYLTLLIIVLYLFGKSGIFYNIYLHPYAIVLIAHVISAAISKKGYQRHIAIIILICIFLIYFIKIIPNHSKLLATISIAFNPKLEDYDISSSFNAALMLKPWNSIQISRFCIENHFDYLVVGENFLEKFKLDKNIFKLIKSIPKSYWIYKVIPPG